MQPFRPQPFRRAPVHSMGRSALDLSMARLLAKNWEHFTTHLIKGLQHIGIELKDIRWTTLHDQIILEVPLEKEREVNELLDKLQSNKNLF